MSDSQPEEIVVAGAGGRMGRTIIELLPEFDEFQLAGALEHSDSDLIDEPVTDFAELPEGSSMKVSDDPEAILNENQILIDFTRPEATRTFLKLARNRGAKMVIGTTGLTEEDHRLLDEASEETALVQAPNMSVGVNLLRNLVRKTTETLEEGFDVEILEMHHRHKEDAPSGTANMLAEEVASTRSQNLDEVKTTGREGFVGERDSNEIGILSMRGGDVVGDHTVTFAGEGERVELTHKASSRSTFARGALRAADFLRNHETGRFSMDDVLGL